MNNIKNFACDFCLRNGFKHIEELYPIIDKAITEYNKQHKSINIKPILKIVGHDEYICSYTITRMKKENGLYIFEYSVEKDKIQNIWGIIKILTSKQQPTITYKEIISALISCYNLNITIDAFNGGKNRAKYLFPLYYKPIQILQHLGYIEYKKGTIKRLNFDRAQMVKY